MMKKTASSVAAMVERSRGHGDGLVDGGTSVAEAVKATKESHQRNRVKHLRAHADGHGSKARQNPEKINEAIEE